MNNKKYKRLEKYLFFEKHTSSIEHITPNKRTIKHNKIICPNSTNDIEMYNDLIICDDDCFIVIEVKYKLLKNGAQDIGVFDYIWDA